MARVAKALGFTTMSLYRHVRSKEELLVLMLDRGDGHAARAPYDGWREGSSSWAWDLLRMVREHPWVLYVRISPPPATPISVTLMERGLSPLADTALSEQEKAHLILMLTATWFWMARLETELAPGTGDRGGGGGGATDPLVAYITVMHTLGDDRWPAVKRAVDGGVFDGQPRTRATPISSSASSGVLDGIAALIQARGCAPPARRRCGVVDAHAGHRHARRHLRDRQQRVKPAGRPTSTTSAARRSPAGRLCAATTPGSAADRPAPAMITAGPRIARVLGVLGDHVGSRCADITRTSCRMPRSSSSFAAAPSPACRTWSP
jgi:AcrR family transcriptional regulator